MKQYEVTFIVDPVLSGDEIKATANAYVDMIKGGDANIVHVDEMGLRQLAYQINKRSSGIYYCIEFQIEKGGLINEYELAMRRDDRILRFLTVRLEKYGIKYNEDKRNGLIGKAKKIVRKEEKADNKRGRNDRNRNNSRPKKEAPKADAPKPETAEATAEAPKAEE